MLKNLNKQKNNAVSTLSIIGDSFSSEYTSDSWVSMLGNRYKVKNFSQRGISEYRLYCNILNHIEEITKSDLVIIFHTNPDRVFVPDGVVFDSRQLPTHPYCDLVASDSITSNNWKYIAETYYKYFFDQTLQNFLYQSIVEKTTSLCLPNLVHCTGFQIPQSMNFIKSFHDVYMNNPGDINHMDRHGNQIVYEYLEKIIYEKI